MKIFLFTRNDSHPLDWDEYIGFVVSAKDEREARKLINDKMKEGFILQDSSWFNISLIGYKIDFKPEIILNDFNQG